MPLIEWCEQRKFRLFHIMRFSTFLFALSFAVLYLVPRWLPLGGHVRDVPGRDAELPSLNRFAFDRSDQGPPGACMALFTISWSVASIVGHPWA